MPILDLGFLRSDATYDVVAVWNGRFFRLDKHLDRFFRGPREAAPGAAGRPRRADARARRLRAPRGHRRRLRRGHRDARHARGGLARHPAVRQPDVLLRDPVRLDRDAGAARAGHPAGRRRARSASRTGPSIRASRTTTGSTSSRRCSRPTTPAATTSCSRTARASSRRAPDSTSSSCATACCRTPATNVLEGITRMTVLDIARELGIPAEVGEVTVRRAAQRRRGVRRQHGRRRLLRHVRRRGAAAATAASARSRSGSTTPTGPGTTTRASRSRSPTCRRSMAHTIGVLARAQRLVVSAAAETAGAGLSPPAAAATARDASIRAQFRLTSPARRTFILPAV